MTSPALAPSNVSATGLVIRRGTRIGQGENTFGYRKIELGVRRCMVGGSDQSKRAAAPDRGGAFFGDCRNRALTGRLVLVFVCVFAQFGVNA
uniref:hypothetical protein n=1 Tax=Yoonia sp. TaxID=2212373 RepID=UPI0040470EEB